MTKPQLKVWNSNGNGGGQWEPLYTSATSETEGLVKIKGTSATVISESLINDNAGHLCFKEDQQILDLKENFEKESVANIGNIFIKRFEPDQLGEGETKSGLSFTKLTFDKSGVLKECSPSSITLTGATWEKNSSNKTYKEKFSENEGGLMSSTKIIELANDIQIDMATKVSNLMGLIRDTQNTNIYRYNGGNNSERLTDDAIDNNHRIQVGIGPTIIYK